MGKGLQPQEDTIMDFHIRGGGGKLAWKWVGGEGSSGACRPCFIIRLIETIKANSDLH